MDTTESCVPPGFRFHPTDEELVGYYLRRKAASEKIDLDVIREVDLYRIEPWDIQERCRIGNEEQKEWYFFSYKDKKYPTGTRTNRATIAGFWKATGRDKAVYSRVKLIGMRKTLVFYKGRAPNCQKTDWIMHEYRLESEGNWPPQEEGWVVCRAFKKRITSQTRSIGGWYSSNLYEEPIDHITRQPPSFLPQNLMSKEDTEGHNLSFMQYSDQFVELPQLESPSLPPIRGPTGSISLVLENKEKEECIRRHENSQKLTDLRALDKFFASELSQEERYEGDGVSSFEAYHDSDIGFFFNRG